MCMNTLIDGISCHTVVTGTSSIQTPPGKGTSVTTSSPSRTLLKRKHATSSQEDSSKVFNFGDARVREYLSSLSSEESSCCSGSPSEMPKPSSDQFFSFSPIPKKHKRSFSSVDTVILPIYEDVSQQSDQSVEILHCSSDRLSISSCKRLSSSDNVRPNEPLSPDGQENNQSNNSLKNNTEELSCDVECLGEPSVTGVHFKMEGPLTRSRKRRLDDSSSSSSLVNGSSSGGSGDDSKPSKRKRYQKRQHNVEALETERV